MFFFNNQLHVHNVYWFFQVKSKRYWFPHGGPILYKRIILYTHGDYFVALMNSTCNQYYSSFLHFLLETQNQKFCLQIVTDVPYDVDVGYCAFPGNEQFFSYCKQTHA